MSGFDVAGAVTAALQCADVLARVCMALARFEHDRRHIGSRVEVLQKQLRNLKAVVESLHYRLDARKAGKRPIGSDEARILCILGDTLSDCRETMSKFELELAAVHGSRQYEKLKESLLHSAMATLKLKQKRGVVDAFEREVEDYLRSVHMHLLCLHE
jgi:hypothetical protein